MAACFMSGVASAKAGSGDRIEALRRRAMNFLVVVMSSPAFLLVWKKSGPPRENGTGQGWEFKG
jgi:hypothetical protein